MTRKDYLLELIDSIYESRRVNYDGDAIVSKSGLCDKTKNMFKSSTTMGSYAEKFKELFYMTFEAESVYFLLDYRNNDYNFTREIAYKNVRKYLETKGVKFHLWNNITIEDYDHLILEFLNKEIVPVIFCSYIGHDDNYPDDMGDDNIDEEFISVIRKINDKIFGESLFLSHRVRNKNVLQLYDKCDERDCNYAIPMTMHSVTDSYHTYFPRIEAYVERLVVNNQRTDDKQDSFEEMVSGYIKLPLDPNAFFDLPKTSQDYYHPINSTPSREQSRIFPVSFKKVRSELFSDREFYFITCINEYMLKANSYNIQNHEDLDRHLRSKAKIVVDDYYKEQKFIYYTDLIKYIEDVVERIFRIDIDLFIDVRSEDLEVYRKNIECFNIDVDYIIDFLKDSLNGQIQIYLMIERIIKDFSEALNQCSHVLSVDMNSILNHNDIDNHLKIIKQYIDSDYLNKAIQHQEKSVSKFPGIYNKVNNSSKLNGVMNPSLYSELKKALHNYYELLSNNKLM